MGFIVISEIGWGCIKIIKYCFNTTLDKNEDMLFLFNSTFLK
jgi:hypothetical protein